MATFPSLPPGVLSTESPSFISARSANSLISFSRPTRIQAVTLHFLNRLLDELLLLILASAKSVSTDRIKSDGIMRVLGTTGSGALLAKNAVLEAELEMRSYVDGMRKEGNKVPLGLLATSRLDGTDNFPVKAAYEALRQQCEYYSTLGTSEDPSPRKPNAEIHIMSPDGKPAASFNPPTTIYVTALLEFVAEHILNNIGRVIERDNSDEAGLSDLRKALEEDEGCASWWDRLATRVEMRAREAEEDQGKRGTARPWQVPNESELDEAAGRKKFARQSLTLSGANGSPLVPNTPRGPIHGRESSMANSVSGGSVQGHGDHDGLNSPVGTSVTHGSSIPGSASYTAFSATDSIDTAATSAASNSNTPTLGRRTSSDKGWGGLLSGRRRGSFRGSQDLGAPIIKQNLSPTDMNADAFEPDDDFEALMMSGQTMKVSLTPNRLRTIEVPAKEKEDGKRNARQRPGTLNVVSAREGESGPTTPGRTSAPLPSPAPSMASRRLSQQLSPTTVAEQPSPEAAPGSAALQRSGSRASSIRPSNSSRTNLAGTKQPPSAYRGPSDAGSVAMQPRLSDQGSRNGHADDDLEVEGNSVDSFNARRRGANGSVRSLQPRTEQASSVRDMVDMFNAAPPSPIARSQFDNVSTGRESRQSEVSLSSSLENQRGSKSAIGGRMRSLFGGSRKSSDGRAANGRMGSSASARGPFGAPAYAAEDAGSSIGHGSSSVAHGASTPRSLSAQQQGLLAASSVGRSASRPTSSKGRVPVPTYAADDDLPATLQNSPTSVDHAVLAGDAAAGMAQPPYSEDLTGHDVEHQQGAGVVGLYEEPRRAATPDSPPPTPGQQPREEPPSRKIPWSYSRQSTGNAAAVGASIRRPGSSAAVERNSAAIAAAAAAAALAGPGAGSVASSSANDHGPSAWSAPAALDGEDALAGGKTPTPAQIAASSSRASFGIARPSSSSLVRSDLSRVLANLSRRMRDCTTAEECRLLVNQALAQSAASVHSGSGDRDIVDIPDEESSIAHGGRHHGDGRARQIGGLPVGVAASERYARTPTPARAMPIMPMADGYDVFADVSSPAYKQVSQLAAWLLDEGADAPQLAPAFEPHSSARSHSPPLYSANGSHGDDFDSSAEAHENGEAPSPRRYAKRSAGDGSAKLSARTLDYKPNDPEVQARRASNVSSHSTGGHQDQVYKDAEEHVEDE